VSGPKPFEISRHMVYEAYLKVKAINGAAGVDGQTVEQFGQDRLRQSGPGLPPCLQRGGNTRYGDDAATMRSAQIITNAAVASEGQASPRSASRVNRLEGR